MLMMRPDLAGSCPAMPPCCTGRRSAGSCDHPIPLLGPHAQHQPVVGDASVVDEHAHRSQISSTWRTCTHGVFVADVALTAMRCRRLSDLGTLPRPPGPGCCVVHGDGVPSAASWRAMARPMPRDAPVTSATRSHQASASCLDRSSVERGRSGSGSSSSMVSMRCSPVAPLVCGGPQVSPAPNATKIDRSTRLHAPLVDRLGQGHRDRCGRGVSVLVDVDEDLVLRGSRAAAVTASMILMLA